MKRRDSLKYIAATALASTAIATGCKPSNKNEVAKITPPKGDIHRYEDELKHENEIAQKPVFFTKNEMATITILADIIIPKDDISGSASDAKVPEFLEFTVKDQPQLQVPIRGGLRWLDVFCLKKFNTPFRNCTERQRIEVVDLIAYPEKAKKRQELSQGVSFFSLIRNLTATGFYTSEIGIKDLGYAGNIPNQWNGVPDAVLQQYGLSYSERELKECVHFDNPTPLAD